MNYQVRAESSKRRWLSTLVFFALTIGSPAIHADIPPLVIDQPTTLIDETRTSVDAEAGDTRIFVLDDGFIDGADVLIGGESNRVASHEPGAIGLEQPLAMAHPANSLVVQQPVFSDLTVASRLTVVATRFDPQIQPTKFQIPVNGNLIVRSGGILESSNGSISGRGLAVEFEVSSDISVDGMVGREGNTQLHLTALSGSVTISGTTTPEARLKISAGTNVTITSDLTMEWLVLDDIGGSVTTEALTATGDTRDAVISIENIGGSVETGALTAAGPSIGFIAIVQIVGNAMTGTLTATGALKASIDIAGIGGIFTSDALIAAGGLDGGRIWIDNMPGSTIGMLAATGGFVGDIRISRIGSFTIGSVTATGDDTGFIIIRNIGGSFTTGTLTAAGSTCGWIYVWDIGDSVTTDALTAKGGDDGFIIVEGTGDLTFLGPVIAGEFMDEPAESSDKHISLSSLEGKVSINANVTTEDDTLCVSGKEIDVASNILLSAARS